MKKHSKFILGIVIGFIIGFGVANINWGYFNSVKCDDGTRPDSNGCCTGEIYTDMGEQGFNCCPESGEDCFPPIK